ncbi:MAG: Gfo/Idh/MocA family oxidoreductase [Phycisphaerae bacterium]|nr:Gfo/Idh/MocA family oxidoreductase [Phycisphaerae bacterium]
MAGKLKLGVIGIGTIGNVHLNAYQAGAADRAEVTALCDIVPERMDSVGDRLGVKDRFTDYRDLLKADVDAVLVCTWNNLHREMATGALKAGKHVFLEKPMALNAREAQQIVDAADKSGKVLQIGMVYRQAAEAQLVRQYVRDGVLGQVYHMRVTLLRRRGIPGMGGWFTTKSRSGGGPLIDIGVHYFDISMFMSELWKPTSVSAMTYAKFGCDMKNYNYVGMWAGPPDYKGTFDVEDFATGFVRYGDQASMEFNISWAANTDEGNSIEILGDKGGARLFDGKPLRLYTEFNRNIADIAPQTKDDDRFQLQARSFVAACRGETPPAATGREGLTVMKLIDAVYASGQKGKEVAISI